LGEAIISSSTDLLELGIGAGLEAPSPVPAALATCAAKEAAMLLLGLLSPFSPSFGPLLPESLLPGDVEGGGIVTFLSALVPSTETSCLVVGSIIAILFLSLVRVEVWLGGPPECAGGP
jgi:hypothetical protein